MARIIRSPEAKADALEIWSYIAEDNPTAADRLLDRFDNLFRQLLAQPQLGKAVPELAVNLRFIPVGAYLIFYRLVENDIQVVRILHGARDITAEFFR